jgi:hypothetical protein
MLQINFKKLIKPVYVNFIIEALYFIAFFLYLLLVVNPLLIYQAQQPVFFFDTNFFGEFLGYPGGFLEYIASLLSQFFYYPFWGALVVTIIAWLISVITKDLIKSASKIKQVQFLHFIPATLLLILHLNYNFQLLYSLGLLSVLSFYSIFIHFAPGKSHWRIIYYIIFSIVGYYISGGIFLLTALLCAIYEILYNKKYIAGIVYLLISAVLPFIAVQYLFIYTLKDAFLHSIAFDNISRLSSVPYILYAFFPFILIVAILSTRVIPEKIKNRIFKPQVMNSILGFIIQAVIIFGASYFLLNTSFDEYRRNFLSVDYYAQMNDWKNLLKTVTPQMMNDKLIAFHYNRALYHSGKMSDFMFAYPQPSEVEGLVLSDELGFVYPLQRCDLFFELGHLNEAQHWVCESLAHRGYTPWNLQRLALISILKDNNQVANKCLNLLDKTMFFRKWSEKYRNYLKDKSLIDHDPYLKNIKLNMPKTDFIDNADIPDADLESLLTANKTNKMAYEYLMAYYLLSRKLTKFINNVERLNDFDYKRVPYHYEEAILAYMIGKGKETLTLPKFHPNPKIMGNFRNLLNILKNYRGDKNAAYNTVITKFGNTYWPYLLYK